MESLAHRLSRTNRTSGLVALLTWGAGFFLMFGSTFLDGRLAEFAVAAGIVLMFVGFPFWLYFVVKQIGAVLTHGHLGEQKRPPRGPN
jgi:ABC-type Fe3+-siderophore transport system permease subunit